MLGNHQSVQKRYLTLMLLSMAIVMLPAPPNDPRATGTADRGSAGRYPLDELNTKAIDQIIGRSGEMKEGVYKIGLPRTDLRVISNGVAVRPGLALGSWAAFDPMGSHVLAMGDLVLLENEVNPVLSKLQDNGVEISAIHNHLLNEHPRVMYMHFMGFGTEDKLARTLKEALALTGTPLGPARAAAQSAGTDEWKKVQEIIGVQGRERGGVYQIGVARKEKITMPDGAEVPPFMGTATAINFQKSRKGVATTGDFVMIASEVNPVIRELKKAGIQITALHSHMLNESPRLFFMHFWGNGDPAKVARGLRAAIEKTNSVLQ